MALPSSDGIDEAMAKILIQPSSTNALLMVREARRLKVLAEVDGYGNFLPMQISTSRTALSYMGSS